MKKSNLLFGFFFYFIFFGFGFCSAEHFILGEVEDALDGESVEGHVVVLWNAENGISDNLTYVIDFNNNFSFDCENLVGGCKVNDELHLKVFNQGDNYVSEEVAVVVSGGGEDLVESFRLNSPLDSLFFLVDDDINISVGEIDLAAGYTRFVECEGVFEDLDGDAISNVSAEFFSSSSFFGDMDDNNFHYSNQSCFVNSSYGENLSMIVCGFDVWYYAESDEWQCKVSASDGIVEVAFNNFSFVNELLSLEVPSSVDFGVVNPNSVSNEAVINISNFGNVEINLSIYGYAEEEGDGYAMNCGVGKVPVGYKKYNFTSSNIGVIDYEIFDYFYQNLTDVSTIRRFDLDFRKNDLVQDAIGFTYWRVFLPKGVDGTCVGNIVFSAVRSSED
ncbi:MAG: hypothetical protein OQK82_04375 [Candidatus Pacearchaeota archaeon]|nr:hypothetical protein [Candidatus Pacearchaeota archaeon]